MTKQVIKVFLLRENYAATGAIWRPRGKYNLSEGPPTPPVRGVPKRPLRLYATGVEGDLGSGRGFIYVA
jgi:hypothetical protein